MTRSQPPAAEPGAVASRDAPDDHGFVTVQYVAATAFSLVLLVLFANLLVDLYARAAVRDALDEGARAAAIVGGGPRECEERARAVVSQLVRGSAGRDIDIECVEPGNGFVRARARVRLRAWLPGVPDWTFTVTALGREEPT